MKNPINISLLILTVCIILVSFGCANDPTIPDKNDITATISGEYNMNYGAPGAINILTGDTYTQLMLSSAATINNTKYTLGVFIVFKDKTIKLGTYKVYNLSAKPAGDYAMGIFTIGDSPSKKEFQSDSGTVKLTSYNNDKVSATFDFYATYGDKQVHISNGIVDF